METLPMQTAQTQIEVSDFIRKVYNWMAVGLGLTGVVALYVANSQTLTQFILWNPLLFFGVIIGEVALVFYLSARVDRMQPSTATGLFILYAVLNGATLSFIFHTYTGTSIAQAFFISAATFIVCSIYGMTTKRDLTSLGGFMAMGLFGIIIASVVNLFVRSSAMSVIVSYIGVLVFVGLTAYDTQRLKAIALSQPESEVAHKGAILGALALYLDFINLFLMLLRIVSWSRD